MGGKPDRQGNALPSTSIGYAEVSKVLCGQPFPFLTADGSHRYGVTTHIRMDVHLDEGLTRRALCGKCVPASTIRYECLQQSPRCSAPTAEQRGRSLGWRRCREYC